MRVSFFGTQEGDFSITLQSIKALKKAPSPSEAQTVESDLNKVEAGLPAQSSSTSNSSVSLLQSSITRPYGANMRLYTEAGSCVDIHLARVGAHAALVLRLRCCCRLRRHAGV